MLRAVRFASYAEQRGHRTMDGGGSYFPTDVVEINGIGVSAEADWRMTSIWMLGLRYDWMSPNGLKKLPTGSGLPLNVDASSLAPILKYYPSPTIGLYVRVHVNLEGATKNTVNRIRRAVNEDLRETVG